MTSRFFNNIAAILLVAAAISFSSCGDDDQPEVTKVFGTVTIENAEIWASWLDSGEVEVTIFPEFSLDPMAGWGEVPDDFFGVGVPGGVFPVGAPYNSQNPVVLTYEPGKTVYDYEIEVEPGKYSALGLGFLHSFVTDPSRRTATLGVHWNKENEVSHGIVIKVDVGGGMIVPIFNYSAPSVIEIEAGEQLELNFRGDFDFVNQWYQ